jgi:hypothetical protein
MGAGMLLVRLGDITRLQDDKRANLSPRQCADQPGEYPYYGPQGIIAHIASYAYEGDYLLVAESPRGGEAAAPASGRFSASGRVHVLRCGQDAEPRFLSLILNGLPRKALPRSLHPGTLENLEFFLPPPEDQRQILLSLGLIEKKAALLDGQNRVLHGLLQSLFDRYFIYGGGNPRPLGDFIEYQDQGQGQEPASPPGAVPALSPTGGAAFHKLRLCPREGLHPLFTGALVQNPEFLAYAENCFEYQGGKRRLNGKLLMAFELSGPAEKWGKALSPAGQYQEFNQFADGAEKKLAANRAEAELLQKLEQCLLAPFTAPAEE